MDWLIFFRCIFALFLASVKAQLFISCFGKPTAYLRMTFGPPGCSVAVSTPSALWLQDHIPGRNSVTSYALPYSMINTSAAGEVTSSLHVQSPNTTLSSCALRSPLQSGRASWCTIATMLIEPRLIWPEEVLANVDVMRQETIGSKRQKNGIQAQLRKIWESEDRQSLIAEQ